MQPQVDVRPPRRAIPLRHSVAALRAGESGRNQRSIAFALLANLIVAAAKLVAGLTTGSVALLAEAAHSTADSFNELLLGLSLKRGRRPSDALHPLGHGGARFLWAFADAIAALLIGLLLAGTAFGLARPLADLLIGRSMLPARFERVYAIIERSPSIDEVLSVQAVYGAPQEVIVAAKVHPAPGKTADELASALDDIDHTLRRELPEVAEVFIDLTSHRVSSAGEDG